MIKPRISLSRLNNIRWVLLFFLLFVLIHSSCTKEEIQSKEYLYVGTQSSRGSQGIYVFEFDRDSVKFFLIQTTPEIRSPNFLAIHPSKKYLFSNGSVIDSSENRTPQLTAFKINKANGMLSLINKIRAYGRNTIHLSLDVSGKYIYNTFFESSHVNVFPVNTDGSFGDTLQTITYEMKSQTERSMPVHRHQERSHVHSALISPDNAYAYVADLGDDKIFIYSLDGNTGKLTPATVPWISLDPGSGPRHMTFHPNKSFIYVAEQLSSSVRVLYQNSATGELTSIQTISTIPEYFTDENNNSDVHTDPDGKFLYVSNRGHNSLAIYSIDQETGRITLIGHQSTLGMHPWYFLIEPEGDFLIASNRNTDNIELFRRDKNSGLLEYTGVSLIVPAPVCLRWLKL